MGIFTDDKYAICFKDRLQRFTRKCFQRTLNSLQKYRHEHLMRLRFRNTGLLGSMASYFLCVTCRLGMKFEECFSFFEEGATKCGSIVFLKMLNNKMVELQLPLSILNSHNPPNVLINQITITLKALWFLLLWFSSVNVM